MTALWLSPVYRNPEGTFSGSGGHGYEAYHGYWPVDDRAVDPRLGGDAALRAVITAAHARGLRVILDFVPNHVHESNPRYLEHAEEGWFNNGPTHCVCGAPGLSTSTMRRANGTPVRVIFGVSPPDHFPKDFSR